MFGAFISSIKEGYFPSLFQMINLITIGGGPLFFSKSGTETEENDLSSTSNKWIPLSIILLLSAAPMALLFFLLSNYDNLEKEPFNKTWGTLY
jgi:hypothetical protein